MYAAANKKGGVGGVPQSVGKEFTSADEPGNLPEKVGAAPSKKSAKASKRYG